jgi:hypothetical protein
MRDVILAIRADVGTFLNIVMPLSEATQLIKMHKEGILPSIIGGILPNGGAWTFDSKKITLLHTQELETLDQVQQQGTYRSPMSKYPISGFR